LKYNVELGGYQTMVTVDQIQGAPKHARGSDWDLGGAFGPRAVDSYYGIPI
jgi:hypothetical protein